MAQLLLPDKHTKLDKALLGQAAFLLGALGDVQRVAPMWATFKRRFPDTPFDRFALSLDVLFALGLIELLDNGVLVATQ